MPIEDLKIKFLPRVPSLPRRGTVPTQRRRARQTECCDPFFIHPHGLSHFRARKGGEMGDELQRNIFGVKETGKVGN